MQKLLRYLPIAVLMAILGVAAVFVIQVVQIQLRLSRNGAIGKQLVQSLERRFPAATFRSAASYQSEVVYITALQGIEEAARPEVEQWLRAHKNERALPVQVWLIFLVDDDEKRIKI